MADGLPDSGSALPLLLLLLGRVTGDVTRSQVASGRPAADAPGGGARRAANQRASAHWWAPLVLLALCDRESNLDLTTTPANNLGDGFYRRRGR